VSEELENSLQQAIESYLGERLRAIDEQLSRLQAEFSDAVTRLRESAEPRSLEGTPLADSVAGHLQAARAQRLAQGAVSASESAGEFAAVKRVVAAIERQQSQGDILGTLLTGASQFAERVALFVVKNDQALGWRECEAGDPRNLESIRNITLPLSAETLLTCAVRSGSPWSGVPGSNSEDDLLISQLGGEPQLAAAMPLVVRGKVVAVLYADATSSDPNAVNNDALELLAQVAGMAVGLNSGARPAPESQVSEPEKSAEPAVAEQVSEPEQSHEAEPRYEPEVEPQVPEVAAEAEVEAVSASEVTTEQAPEFVSEQATEVIAEPAPEVSSDFEVDAVPVAEESVPVAEVEMVPEHATEVVPKSHVEARSPESSTDFVAAEVVAEEVAEEEEAVQPEALPEPSLPSPAPAPAFVPPVPVSTVQYSTPLGRSRSRVSEPELPIEVSEEERRLHHDARRFARLLVSEIKLYNEPKVKEGRNQGNLYERLREDIDRSRQMYDKRVAPPVAARHDYFHQELVNTLAEGDSAKLGAEYPGASVAMV
jgi:hypothetical protein